jgi:four helix bundle suffix protein
MSQTTPTTQNSPTSQSFRKRPGYEYLVTYMFGKVIHDLTYDFCLRFLKNPNDPNYPNYRQIDQMTQAARSNPQNIAEGYTNESLSTYIQLTSVARGSNEELAKDYEDFLRFRRLEIWGRDHPKVRGFRAFRVVWKTQTSLNTPNLPTDPIEGANMLLTFCQMEGYLLKQQVVSLELKHQTEGGFREKLLKKRLEYRRSS